MSKIKEGSISLSDFQAQVTNGNHLLHHST